MTASPVGEQDGRRSYTVLIGAKEIGSLDFLRPFFGNEWECFDL